MQLIQKYPGCGQDDYSGNDVEGTFFGYASNCHAVTMTTAIKKIYYGQVVIYAGIQLESLVLFLRIIPYLLLQKHPDNIYIGSTGACMIEVDCL